MGFGSGHHATTRLCLAALQRLDLRGRRVLDIGTGSGVLALAAARLGAAGVLAIDVDADALDNARANAALNGGPRNVEFRLRRLPRRTRPRADVVVANLTGGMLAAGAADLAGVVRRGGTLILSGITVEEGDTVYRGLRPGFRRDWSADEDGWCARCCGGTAVSSSAGSRQQPAADRMAAFEPRVPNSAPSPRSPAPTHIAARSARPAPPRRRAACGGPA